MSKLSDLPSFFLYPFIWNVNLKTSLEGPWGMFESPLNKIKRYSTTLHDLSDHKCFLFLLPHASSWHVEAYFERIMGKQ